MLMKPVYLERITVRFPHTHIEFTSQLALLLDALGQVENHVLDLTSSDQSFFPIIRIDFQSEHAAVLTDFTLSNGETTSVKIENSTGLNKQSPHSYKPIRVGTVSERFLASGVKLVGIDHVGFNLPWFSSGLHPAILGLREHLSSQCLYHEFPTGEPWDFIIPGDTHEIDHHKAVDYTKIRRPKFEVVSFDKASTPLIQFDVGVNLNYETFAPLFPESINDPEFRNIWVYLENPFPIDVCLVINRFGDGDWSEFFKESRL
jgi:hypothetical protein